MYETNRILNRLERPGWIYFVRQSDGLTKIGFSLNPINRLKQLATGHCEQLKLIHTIQVDDMPSFEDAFHYSARNRRVRGEWFDLPDSYLEWVQTFSALKDDDDGWIACSERAKEIFGEWDI